MRIKNVCPNMGRTFFISDKKTAACSEGSGHKSQNQDRSFSGSTEFLYLFYPGGAFLFTVFTL